MIWDAVFFLTFEFNWSGFIIIPLSCCHCRPPPPPPQDTWRSENAMRCPVCCPIAFPPSPFWQGEKCIQCNSTFLHRLSPPPPRRPIVAEHQQNVLNVIFQIANELGPLILAPKSGWAISESPPFPMYPNMWKSILKGQAVLQSGRRGGGGGDTASLMASIPF